MSVTLPIVCAAVFIASWQAFHGQIFHDVPPHILFAASALIFLGGWWLAHRGRWSGFFILFSWFAGASFFIPSMYVVFTRGSFAAGVGWYFLFCLLSSAFALAVSDRHGLLRLPLAVLLHALSPIGAFSPLLAVLALFPGLGVVALLAGTLLLFGVGIKKIALPLLGLAAIVALVVNAAYQAPDLPDDVWAVTTFEGPKPASAIEWAARQDRLVDRVLSAQSMRLIVLPEATVDRPGLLNMARWLHVASLLQGQARLMVGVTHSGENYLMDMTDGKRYYATIPMVVGLWHPWNRREHYPIRFSALTDLADIGAYGRLPYLICYEETLIYPLAAKMLVAGKPMFIITISNQWFATGMAQGARRAQDRSGVVNARTWGVAVLRAVNGPSFGRWP